MKSVSRSYLRPEVQLVHVSLCEDSIFEILELSDVVLVEIQLTGAM